MNYDVSLIYSFEKSGVLLDANDDTTVIPEINSGLLQAIKSQSKKYLPA